IDAGSLPCANPAQARQVLAGRVEDVFDARGPARAISDWLSRHAESLRPLMAREAAKLLPAGGDVIEHWLDAMLAQAVNGGMDGLAEMRDQTARDSAQGVPLWLLLLGLWKPVVLLVDHLDGYYRNAEAGVAIASLLMDLVDGHGIHVLLSLNQDVWQATFGHHLPSALEDRLTASQVLLRGLREADAAELLRLRLERAGVTSAESAEFATFVDVKRHFIGRPVGSVSARAFLRHCARQWEIFQNSPPSPASAPEEDADTPGVFPATSELFVESPTVPLVTDTVAEGLPDIFDADTTSEMKIIAEGLAEPAHALPQNKLPDILPPSPPPASEPALDFPPAQTHVAPAADAFVKLREMLHRLRETDSAHPDSGTAPSSQIPPQQAPPPPSLSSPAVPPPPAPPKPDPAADLLLGRFGALRMQMHAEASSQPLDSAKLTDLVRLAGRRFPLVRLSEHELPGMTGRHTLCWSLQGLEIIFGLSPMSDLPYWRTLAGFCAGRQADLADLAEKEGRAAPKVKWVIFNSAHDDAAWQTLAQSGEIPAPLRDSVDLVWLEPGEIAALYAMQRIIKEAESGVL
ncbi:MAG TPA: hypothetical protein PLP58_23490, partial [Prosthecobacter sp.]|nr:hypothetical protein [Prosthecobacter sp.]